MLLIPLLLIYAIGTIVAFVAVIILVSNNNSN